MIKKPKRRLLAGSVKAEEREKKRGFKLTEVQDRGGRTGHFRWRGMETETKQRQDINQGNATAWQTVNDTIRKQNKRERN